ncbi:MAG: aldo/keto reductase [Novosphingobium sp.]|nr:aldo/keto reductase [Novosphingobium sp.]MBO9602920.1 aldo/keto reductase [Novosphingobium sp.]
MTHAAIGGIRLCLGGNVFGWTSDEDTSFAVLDKFYAAGGRMVDTAQGYSVWAPGHVGGESETVLGKWMAARGNRAEMKIATKTGMMGNPGDLAPVKLAEELEKSLDRLQTDYVDIYYAHRDEESTPLDEIAGGFDALVKAGKVREVGASNFTAERLSAALAVAESGGFTPYSVLQNEFNLVNRDAYDAALQQLCVARDIAHLPFFGLASGFLTGKYRTTADFAQSARGGGMDRFFEKGLPVLGVMDVIASETGASHAAIALAWINAQPGIAAPIASARVPEQLDALLEGAGLQLTDDQLARLSQTR